MRLRRSVPLALSATLALSLLGSSPAVSAVDDVPPAITAVKVSPATVVLTGAATTKLTVEVTATDNDRVTEVAAALWPSAFAWPEEAPYGILLDDTDFTRLTGTNVWRASFDVPRTMPTGRYTVMAFAADAATVANSVESAPVFGAFIKRNTKLAINAGPEPVRKGATLKVAGILTRLKPAATTATYVPMAGRTVKLYFKPKGTTTTYTYMATVTTNTYGKYSRSFAAASDGTWQARYAGTANYLAERSAGDYVDVQ